MTAAFLVLSFVLLGPTVAHGAQEPWDELPPGPGRELTYGVCSTCHSMQIVQQQGMTRDQWDETLDWMVEEQGMAELNGPPRDQILDYLSAVFSPDRPFFNTAN